MGYPYVGNTPLHLAMESAHAEAAVLLIEAGADRTRVRPVTSNEVVLTDKFWAAGEPGLSDARAG
jgi:ankyrin repeat protein